MLNRPARRNALSPQLLGLLRSALARADAEPSVHVICLTGAGEKAFCAGADLAAAAEAAADGFLAVHEGRRAYAELLAALPRLGKPVVACVNGAALAGGLGLLCACDFAVAADDALFGTPEIDVGLFPFMALAPLARVVGQRQALLLAMTGRKIDAQEALRLGLVQRVVPRPELAEAAQALCDELAAKSPAVLRLGKRAFYSTLDLPYEAQLEALSAQLSLGALTEDAAEGVAAFLEKRPPDWKGK